MLRVVASGAMGACPEGSGCHPACAQRARLHHSALCVPTGPGLVHGASWVCPVWWGWGMSALKAGVAEQSCSCAGPLYLLWVWNARHSFLPWCRCPSLSPFNLPVWKWFKTCCFFQYWRVGREGDKSMPRLFSRQPYPYGSEAFQWVYLALRVPAKARGAVPLRPSAIPCAALGFCQPLPPSHRKQTPSTTSRCCLYVCARSVCTNITHPMLLPSETSVEGS